MQAKDRYSHVGQQQSASDYETLLSSNLFERRSDHRKVYSAHQVCRDKGEDKKLMPRGQRRGSVLKKLTVPPTLALLVLAPAIGELLSGSSPPVEFFNPIAFLFMTSLYGSGAIIMRELKVRWRKDFRSLLLLGRLRHS